MSLTDVWQMNHRDGEQWAELLGMELERVVGGHYNLGFLDHVIEDFRNRIPAAARDAGVGQDWDYEGFFRWMEQRVSDNQLYIDYLAHTGVLRPVPPSPPLPVTRPDGIDDKLWEAIHSYLTYTGWREPYLTDVKPFCYYGASAVYFLRQRT